MKLRTASAFAALAATLVVAGCGSSNDDAQKPSASAKKSDSYGYDYGTSKPAAPKPAAGSALTLKTANGMLADARGRTLYLWESDGAYQSDSDGAGAQAGQPLTTDGKSAAGQGVDAGLRGTSK